MAPSSEDSVPTPSVPSPSLASAFLVTQSTFIAAATLLVLARVYVRSIIVKNVGLDDFFIVVALIIAFVICVMTSLAVSYGRQYSSQLSHDQTLAALKTLAKGTRLCTISIPIGIFSGLFTRLSVCLFLLRIFRSVRGWRLGLYAIMAFTAAAIIPSTVLFLAQCQPIQKQWNPLLPGKCWSSLVVIRMNYFGGAVSALCDWTLATLPIVFMWNLQMRPRVKVGICVLMGMGYFTGICAIARTVGFKDATASAGHGNPVESVIWAVLEINVGIIAASIPTLKPLFNPSRPSLLRYFRYRKAVDSPQCDGDEARLQKLTLGALPSALPSSLSYYQDKGRSNLRVEKL